MSDNKKFATGERIVTPTYSGPNRRDSHQDRNDARISSRITRDQRGNQVLEVRSDADRRRYDDETVNLLKILEIDGLTLED